MINVTNKNWSKIEISIVIFMMIVCLAGLMFLSQNILGFTILSIKQQAYNTAGGIIMLVVFMLITFFVISKNRENKNE